MTKKETAKAWQEFYESGMFWWVNKIMGTFGWHFFVETKDGKVINVYPGRFKRGGYELTDDKEGYEKLTKYMKKNAEEFEKEDTAR